MQSIIGAIVAIAAAMAVYWSLPRGGKTVWYVGKEWEGYVVVVLVMMFVLGVVLTISGLVA
jgi:hypothetical protein